MDITTLIANLGFPMAVAVWFMVTGKQSQDKLTAAVNNNTTALSRLMDRMNLDAPGKPDGSL